MQQICHDLAEEHADLDAVVAELTAEQWALATPAQGWTVKDQIAHLWFFDVLAGQATQTPQEFHESARSLLDAGPAALTDHVRVADTLTTNELLARWRSARAGMLVALRDKNERDRLPWFGPSMSARSFATARLMETWAHGQDVADALGLHRLAAPRIRNIAHLGVAAFAWSFLNHGLPQPSESVEVTLAGPGTEKWVWNRGASGGAVTGPAVDFCLVVTQRRNVANTALDVTGTVASQWMAIAQAFAGPPTTGPPPR